MAEHKTTTEYGGGHADRDVPEDLEHKANVNAVGGFGYKPSPVPPPSRTSSSLTAAEKAAAMKVPGTLMQSDGSGAQAPSGGTTSGSGG